MKKYLVTLAAQERDSEQDRGQQGYAESSHPDTLLPSAWRCPDLRDHPGVDDGGAAGGRTSASGRAAATTAPVTRNAAENDVPAVRIPTATEPSAVPASNPAFHTALARLW